ncbi:MAG: diguanylate cyclase [Candidatus Binatia bacterium]
MKVLIAEDEPISRRRLISLLDKWGYEVIETCDGAAAWEALQENDGPRIAIFDWQMPKIDGLQLCREVRRVSTEPYLYILLLTSRNQKEDSIAGWEAGVDDYITKPWDAHELRVHLQAAERIIKLQDQLIVARETQRQLATYDALTSVFNRRAILDTLQRELAHSMRGGPPVGVIMVDLDHFKKINDVHGHLLGDLVLCEAAHRMKNALRPYDVLGRYGGEEFLVVAPGCAAQETAKVAERLRERLEGLPLTLRDKSIRITGSFGAASSKDVAEDVDAVVWAADAALYRAKREGRNRVVTWNGDSLSPERPPERYRA